MPGSVGGSETVAPLEGGELVTLRLVARTLGTPKGGGRGGTRQRTIKRTLGTQVTSAAHNTAENSPKDRIDTSQHNNSGE